MAAKTDEEILEERRRKNRLATVQHLMSQASDSLLARGPEDLRALWRLVDAAGIVAEMCDWKGVGADDPTGRGFRVVKGD